MKKLIILFKNHWIKTISHAEIDDFDASDDLQNIDIAPDLPILEDELNSAPEQFVSLADENERDILIDSEEIDSSEQDESSVIDSTPVKEETVQPEDMGSILPDQINNDSDNLAIIDAIRSEQLSVEHDDEYSLIWMCWYQMRYLTRFRVMISWKNGYAFQIWEFF